MNFPSVVQVSQEDCIKKQIIQSLCISSLPHSELNKLLVEDVNGETGIESVIRDVATSRRTPSGDMYDLKPGTPSSWKLILQLTILVLYMTNWLQSPTCQNSTPTMIFFTITTHGRRCRRQRRLNESGRRLRRNLTSSLLLSSPSSLPTSFS